ncbi:hypothetical protein AKJ09_01972 [Labilithrix luteola]|uniref:Uncharacterized protein n=1 Tax=Labilithrix luteola TaxID=1391654 RepID=A0A0K1PP63_9BACT|nr:hypothetical protein AKJ09_01972 [Labilithrix luteola]
MAPLRQRVEAVVAPNRHVHRRNASGGDPAAHASHTSQEPWCERANLRT